MSIPSSQSFVVASPFFSETSSREGQGMNEVERIRKLLADTKAGEKGWRKALATAEGSFSRSLAEKNLSRLAALRVTLLSELNAAVSCQLPGFPAAAKNGVSTDDWSENVAERLLSQS